MDMSFANQAICAAHICNNIVRLASRVHPVPPKIDHENSRMKPDAMKIPLDTLTEEQKIYLSAWQEGT